MTVRELITALLKAPMESEVTINLEDGEECYPLGLTIKPNLYGHQYVEIETEK